MIRIFHFIKPIGLSILILVCCLSQPQLFAQTKPKNNLVTNVKGINHEMLTPDFWQAKLTHSKQPILSSEQIAQQNQTLFAQNPHMVSLGKLSETIEPNALIALIQSISKQPKTKRYYADQSLVSDAMFDNYKANLNLDKIKTVQKVQFGLVVKRTDLRTFPTQDKIFNTLEDTNLDRFQETALFPGQAVAIYHQSSDRKWYFVSSYNYSAWVAKRDIAIGSREQVLEFNQQRPFLVITGDKVLTSSSPYNEKVSQQQLEMGTRLPLLAESDKPVLLDGQNTFASHVIKFPTRNPQGELEIQLALIAKSQDVNAGYLTLNRHHVVQQAFKFLGERYGWGHSFNARDCTGFVGEIYKSFGILMPRNSGQQGVSQQGENIRFAKDTSTEEKLKAIRTLQAGDLIYLPGHVMMYLGEVNEQPYIIHDVAGYSFFDEQGVYQKSKLNGVSVTPLIPLQLNQETSYLDRIYNLKKIK